MTKTAARAGLVTLAVLVGVLNGSPLVVPVIGLAAVALYRLVDYGAREMERALDAASSDRVAQLTWQLQTDAAHLALQQRRFTDELQRMLIPAVLPPVEPELPTVSAPGAVVAHRGDDVHEFLFPDGALLCVPAALQLFRYADAS